MAGSALLLDLVHARPSSGLRRDAIPRVDLLERLGHARRAVDTERLLVPRARHLATLVEDLGAHVLYPRAAARVALVDRFVCVGYALQVFDTCVRLVVLPALEAVGLRDGIKAVGIISAAREFLSRARDATVEQGPVISAAGASAIRICSFYALAPPPSACAPVHLLRHRRALGSSTSRLRGEGKGDRT